MRLVIAAIAGFALVEAASRPKLWVRRPDATTGVIELVPSLRLVCEQHGLDEQAMLAVSRGEQADHKGWQARRCAPRLRCSPLSADSVTAFGAQPMSKRAT